MCICIHTCIYICIYILYEKMEFVCSPGTCTAGTWCEPCPQPLHVLSLHRTWHRQGAAHPMTHQLARTQITAQRQVSIYIWVRGSGALGFGIFGIFWTSTGFWGLGMHAYIHTWVLGSGYLGSGIWDLGSGIWVPGIWDLGSGIWDLGFGIWVPGFWDLGSGIWDLGTWALGSGIWDLGSGIRVIE